MRQAKVLINNLSAGIFTEIIPLKSYSLSYSENYNGIPISLTLPLRKESYNFDHFPSFFDGLLPEGYQLEALLKIKKIDKNDLFSQLIATGGDLVGAVTVEEMV